MEALSFSVMTITLSYSVFFWLYTYSTSEKLFLRSLRSFSSPYRTGFLLLHWFCISVTIREISSRVLPFYSSISPFYSEIFSRPSLMEWNPITPCCYSRVFNWESISAFYLRRMVSVLSSMTLSTCSPFNSSFIFL